jgi:hypothetical protein
MLNTYWILKRKRQISDHSSLQAGSPSIEPVDADLPNIFEWAKNQSLLEELF